LVPDSRRIFLTGATGVVGGYLLKTLLERTSATLYCLIRERDEARALGRIKRILSAYGFGPELLTVAQERVVPLPGDVSQPGLGLAPRAYSALAEEIDVSLHVAGSTSLLGAYEDVKRPNVDGTANLIELALRTPQKRLIYISTFTVMGDRRFEAHEPFLERDLDQGQGFEQLEYERSKFEAEKLIHAASERGLSWLILRLGQIFGDSATGRYPVGLSEFTGVFYDVLKTVTETKVAMNSPAYFDITPVDYACDGILHLAGADERRQETFHLVNPDIKRYSEVIGLIRDCGYEVSAREPGDFLADLRAGRIAVDGRPYRSRTMLLLRRKPKLLASQHSTYAGSAATQALLRAAKIDCPRIDKKLLQTYLDFIRKT
jgi:thioester reductase-like protein